MSERKNRQSLLMPILIPVGALAIIGLVLIGFSRVLLAVSHNAATVVALVVATGIVVVAAWVAGRRRVTGATLFSMIAAVTGIAMISGGLAVVASPFHEEGAGEGPGGEGVVVALEAPEGAAASGFSTEALSVPSDQAFTLAFDNADPAVQHNVVIFDGPDEQAPALFTGEIITGPSTVDYAVESLPEGEFFFHCEVHPTTMTGIATAAPGGGEGGGGGGLTVVAANLEFDTDTIELAAETETTITLDNQDSGIPHNIAIYGDDTLEEVLFQGEIVTGPVTVDYAIPALPEGEYFFHCDVHPNMSGTVIVAAGGGGGGSGGGGSGDQTPPDDGGGGGGATGGAATASIAAQGSVFDVASLSLPASTEVTLTFDNRDDAAVTGPHNVAIYDGDTALFQGELISGPATVDYAIPPLEPGTYEFRCDVHPPMTGTVEVS